jgi:hypothetical protein
MDIGDTQIGIQELSNSNLLTLRERSRCDLFLCKEIVGNSIRSDCCFTSNEQCITYVHSENNLHLKNMSIYIKMSQNSGL